MCVFLYAKLSTGDLLDFIFIEPLWILLYTIGVFFFCATSQFWREIESEDTQERATDVGPVKNKEKKREREGEREREGRKEQKIEVSAPM